jgi:hypothetical protein
MIANHDYHHIDAPQTPERRRLDAPRSPYMELAGSESWWVGWSEMMSSDQPGGGP